MRRLIKQPWLFPNMFILCMLFLLVGCSHEDKVLSFKEQRAEYGWKLPEQIFTSEPHWDQTISQHFSQAGCSSYLSEYIIKSSDIIDHNHFFAYDDFNISDKCVAMLMLFTQFYLHEHDGLDEKLQDDDSSMKKNYTINLSDNPQMSNESIAYLIDMLKWDTKVTRVDVRGNRAITQDAVNVLAMEAKVQVIFDR
jgi:hypothetical protein